GEEQTTNGRGRRRARASVVFPRTTGKKSAKVGAVLVVRERPSQSFGFARRCWSVTDRRNLGASGDRRASPRSRERHVHSHWIFAADAGARDGRTTTGSAAAGIG